MSRPALLALAGLSLFLLVFPLTLDKPGLPQTFKADEAAYYGMALSLAHDGDLELTPDDQERLFREFPYAPINNLIVMTDDGWRTIYYGKPYVYSLFAAPFAALAGANGLLFFNMLMMLAMVWMGSFYLAGQGREADGAGEGAAGAAPARGQGGLAALFAAGFFLASSAFVYVFWLQPEVFNMAAICGSLFLLFHRFRSERWLLARSVASGVLLALAVYNKPMIAALGLPLLVLLARRRQWRAAVAWLAGAALGLAAVAGLATALTGHPTAYLGVERQGVTVCEPDVRPIEARVAEAGPDPERPTGGAWSWIFHLPRLSLGQWAEGIGYFLWGRHTGLLLYLPFAVLAVILFLLHARRDLERWLLLAALVVVALFFLGFIPHNWQGGGGFVGNRYFINVYPAFLFLVVGLRPAWVTVAGYALSGLFLGPLLLSPFSRGGPEPTLQSHVRTAPFALFPVELSLRELPGYYRREVGEVTFMGRRDVFLPQGDQLWTRGASRVELWMFAGEPVERAVFTVRSLAPNNRISVKLGDDRQVVEVGPGEAGASRRIELSPGKPSRVVERDGAVQLTYPMVVESTSGRARTWTRHYPPPPCQVFAYNEAIEETFYTGAALIYLGSGAHLRADLYAVRWGNVVAPEQVPAGEPFEMPVRLFNASDETWTGDGAARVKLGYHWLTPEGEVVRWDGERTEIDLPVPPGGRVSVRQRIIAPQQPGSYLLEIDPLYEQVAWFSQRNGGNTFRAPVEVVEGDVQPGAASPGVAQPRGPSPGPDERRPPEP